MIDGRQSLTTSAIEKFDFGIWEKKLRAIPSQILGHD